MGQWTQWFQFSTAFSGYSFLLTFFSGSSRLIKISTLQMSNKFVKTRLYALDLYKEVIDDCQILGRTVVLTFMSLCFFILQTVWRMKVAEGTTVWHWSNSVFIEISSNVSNCTFQPLCGWVGATVCISWGYEITMKLFKQNTTSTFAEEKSRTNDLKITQVICFLSNELCLICFGFLFFFWPQSLINLPQYSIHCDLIEDEQPQ